MNKFLFKLILKKFNKTKDLIILIANNTLFSFYTLKCRNILVKKQTNTVQLTKKSSDSEN